MFEVGRVCLKIAGRDSGRYCVVIDVASHNTVLVDGQTRRKKCNVKHLEPTSKTVEIGKNASHAEVAKALSGLGFAVEEKKAAAKKSASKKPSRQRVQKAKPEPKPKKETKKKVEKTEKSQ